MALVVALAVAGGLIFSRRGAKPVERPVTPVAPPPATEANFSGLVEPRTTVTAGAPAAGVLDAYFVDVGQEVYQGQLLGRLRNEDIGKVQQNAQAELDAAQQHLAGLNSEMLAAKLELSRATADQLRANADIDRLQKEYTRQKGFWEQGITPRLTYEKAEKDYLSAKTQADQEDAAVGRAKDRLAQLTGELDTANQAIKQANEELEKSKTEMASVEIHSPVDGLVVARRGQPGDAVDASAQDLFRIAADRTALEVDASPDPEILGRMHPGQAVSVRVADLSPDEIPGTVREIRGSQAIIDFTSPVPLQKPDLAAQVKIKF